jgi:hypothetical protein
LKQFELGLNPFEFEIELDLNLRRPLLLPGPAQHRGRARTLAPGSPVSVSGRARARRAAPARRCRATVVPTTQATVIPTLFFPISFCSNRTMSPPPPAPLSLAYCPPSVTRAATVHQKSKSPPLSFPFFGELCLRTPCGRFIVRLTSPVAPSCCRISPRASPATETHSQSLILSDPYPTAS